MFCVLVLTLQYIANTTSFSPLRCQNYLPQNNRAGFLRVQFFLYMPQKDQRFSFLSRLLDDAKSNRLDTILKYKKNTLGQQS